MGLPLRDHLICGPGLGKRAVAVYGYECIQFRETFNAREKILGEFHAGKFTRGQSCAEFVKGLSMHLR